MFKRGIKLLSWILLYSLFSFLFQALLWIEKLSFLRSFVLPLTLGYLLLWFVFGYNSQLGFRKGIIIGFIGAIPAIFFTSVQAFMLLLGRNITGTFFDVLNPITIPLLWFYTAFQQWGIHISLMPYLLTPLLVLLCGIGSYFGFKKH